MNATDNPHDATTPLCHATEARQDATTPLCHATEARQDATTPHCHAALPLWPAAREEVRRASRLLDGSTPTLSPLAAKHPQKPLHQCDALSILQEMLNRHGRLALLNSEDDQWPLAGHMPEGDFVATVTCGGEVRYFDEHTLACFFQDLYGLAHRNHFWNIEQEAAQP